MSGPGDESTALLGAVTAWRGEVATSRLPLDIPQTQATKVHRESLLRQLDDYVVPRLSSLYAPLLAVIGGSTGAGKSTLVNSIVDAEVSRSGILRPTTVSPVLVHHPKDRHWFAGDRVLPGLSRVPTRGIGAMQTAQSGLRLTHSASIACSIIVIPPRARCAL